MTGEGPSEKTIVTVGLSAVGLILIALVVTLIYVTATGRNDAEAQPSKPEKSCLQEASKVASIEAGRVTVEDDSSLKAILGGGKGEECADTEVHVCLAPTNPEDVAALAYDARDITKDGSRCTWTDSKSKVHGDECAALNVGADSEVRRLIVEKVREQLRYPDSWGGELSSSDAYGAPEEAEIYSILIGDRPCTDCTPIEGRRDG